MNQETPYTKNWREENSQEMTRQQSEFLKTIYEKRLPVYVMGGFADDTLLNKSLSRTHDDIDMVALRENKDFLKDEFTKMGFSVKEVTIPPSNKEYKIKIQKYLVTADVAFFDFDNKNKRFSVDLVNPITSEKFTIFFDENGLDFPQQSLNGIKINTISPLALIQSKNIYAQIGSNKPRTEDDQSREKLIKKFFPGEPLDAKKFSPLIVKL